MCGIIRGMKTACPNCHSFFDVDEEYIGYTVSCPYCNAEKLLKNPQQEYNLKRSRAVNQRMQEQNKGNFDGLCFFLGLVFNLIGLLVAAIIGKRVGAVSALWGMLFADIIGVLGYILLCVI